VSFLARLEQTSAPVAGASVWLNQTARHAGNNNQDTYCKYGYCYRAKYPSFASKRFRPPQQQQFGMLRIA
jgi:hypothetical protein